IQLWRTRLVTVKQEEVEGWQTAVEQMPAEVRAGGYFVLGEGLARLNQPEDAALAFLHISVVHQEQRMMAADGLLEAGKQLDKLDRREQAASLYREVATGYSRTSAAEEAKTRLEKK